MLPVALTISGSDPSGGAGLQADLKTFHQLGVYGMSAVTLITVQNTQQVSAVEVLPAELLRAQVEAVIEDIPPGAAKTGSIGSAANIQAVAECAASFSFPLVVDPVMVSKHGAPLLSEDAQEALRRDLLPQALLVTPNRHEAERLAGIAVTGLDSMEEAARRIADLGPRAVLVKGGRWVEDAVDVLWVEGRLRRFPGRRVETRSTHGTGCTFSAAITAGLAQGLDLESAIERAKRFVTLAIEGSPGLGGGYGPLGHHVSLD